MNIKLLESFVIKNDLKINISQNNVSKECKNPYELIIQAIKLETEGEYKLAKKYAIKSANCCHNDELVHLGSEIMQIFTDVRLQPSYDLESQFQRIKGSIEKLKREKLDDINNYNFNFFVAIFYTVNSTYNFYSGNYIKAIDDNLKAITFWQNIDEIDGENLVSIDLQFCYIKTGKFDEALESSDKLIARLNVEQDILTYCHAVLSRSEIFKLLGNYRVASSLLEDGYQKAKNLNNQPLIFHTSRFLANIYAKQGLYGKALDLQEGVLNYFSKFSNYLFNSMILNDLGTTARLSNDFSSAKYYYMESIKQSEKLNIFDEIITSYWNLILNELANTKSNEMLNEFKEKITEYILKVQNPQFTELPKIVKGLILLNYNRLSPKFKAMELFKEILDNPDVYHEYKLTIIYYLTELLINEFEYTRNIEIVEDINRTLEIMYKIGSEMYSFPVTIDYYLLQAKFQKELKNIDLTKIYLEEAKKIAAKSKVSEIIEYIERESDLMISEIDYMTKIERSQLQQSNEFGSTTNFIQYLKTGKSSNTTSVNIYPLLIMIISDGGNNLFSKEFNTPVLSELNLVASFLSAIITFSQEAFVNKSNIELIKIGNENLILHPLGDLIICYIFNGYIPIAIKQLNSFSDKIQESEKIFSQLHMFGIDDDVRQILSIVADEIFIGKL